MKVSQAPEYSLMPVLNLTTDQLIDLVKQLSLEEQQAVIEAIEENPSIPTENPWMQFAGMFKDDPEFDEMLVLMEENRCQFDAEMEEYYIKQERENLRENLAETQIATNAISEELTKNKLTLIDKKEEYSQTKI